MTIQTKSKLWKWCFILIPPLTVLITYLVMHAYGARYIEPHDDLSIGILWFLLIAFNLFFLIAQVQIFLSLRILWFKKDTADDFTYQFHTVRFWGTLGFFVPVFLMNLFLFGINDNLLDPEALISLISCYSLFCIIINLVNLGHWIYTKIPRKPKEETPKEETPKEETDEEAPAHKYKRELERSAIKKWIAIVLAACLLLCAGYLFGYDYNLPTVTATALTQSQVESFLLGDFTYNRDMEVTHVVNNDTFEGVIHYRTLVTDPANARILLDTAKNDVIYRDLSTHYTFDSMDAEAVIPPCYYTPLVKKWGYGWFDQQGNLYADRFGKEKAENVPNYRRYFRMIVRKENAVFDYLIFTNQTNQFSVIHAVREICNTL